MKRMCGNICFESQIETSAFCAARTRPVSGDRFRHLVRVGAKTFAQTNTNITIKLYKKDEEGTFKYRQGITLSTGEFESFAENDTKIKELTKR